MVGYPAATAKVRGSADRQPILQTFPTTATTCHFSMISPRIFGDAFEQAGLDRALGTVVVSQRPELGQFQCNGALPAAKAAGRPPREIAQDIVDRVRLHDDRFADLSLAGPGFINISLTDDFCRRGDARVADDPRLGVPEVQPAEGSRGLWRSQRCQGDACRASARHDHR